MLRMNTTGRVWNIGVEFLLGTENKNLYETWKCISEYLVTFNQNTFYNFVYLGKSLSLSFFKVPDLAAVFKIIFLFASLKMMLGGHILCAISMCVCVYTLFIIMHGEILEIQ